MPKWPPSLPRVSSSPTADIPPRGVIVRALLVGLRVYRTAVSPILPGGCRFAPSCSEFAGEALLRHGVTRGGMLAARRVARCHPWHAGGYDPVPPAGA